MTDDFAPSGTRDLEGPKVLALQACGPQEFARFSCSPDGVAWFGRAMTLAFTEFADEADEDGDGWVSFHEAFRLAGPAVQHVVGECVDSGGCESGASQTPQIHDGIGEPVHVVEVEQGAP